MRPEHAWKAAAILLWIVAMAALMAPLVTGWVTVIAGGIGYAAWQHAETIETNRSPIVIRHRRR